MIERCPFPACISEAEHDGDHQFDRNKPYGDLRRVQKFGPFGAVSPRCDFHFENFARYLYCDERGKSWALCRSCEAIYVDIEEVG